MKKATNISQGLQATYNIMDNIYMVQNKTFKDKAEQIPSKVQKKNKYYYLSKIQYNDLIPEIGTLLGFYFGGSKAQKKFKIFQLLFISPENSYTFKQSKISYRKLL